MQIDKEDVILPHIDFRLGNRTIRSSKGEDAKQIPRSLLSFPPDEEATTSVAITGRLTKFSSCTELVIRQIGVQLSAAV